MKRLDFRKIRTYSAKKRKTKVTLSSFASIPPKNASFKRFYASLPQYLAVNSLKEIVSAIVYARKKKRPVIAGLGAHVIKVGLNPLLIELMKKGIITGIALNGAGAIHDFEIASLGQTSEEVKEGLETGMFGMVEETLRDMNEAISSRGRTEGKGAGIGAGLGTILGKKLARMKAPFRNHSILYNACKLNIPVTVHVAIGTDTIHMSPLLDPRALGEATFNDFKVFASEVAELSGGVYLNIGSAVILPEVFLKALTVARNLGNKVKDFTTVNMDMLQHYRPSQNVLSRPGGRARALTGHHEIMVPLLAQAVLENL